MPLVLSCWTASHETWISKAVSAVALMLDGPTVGSVRRQTEIRRSEHAQITEVSLRTVVVESRWRSASNVALKQINYPLDFCVTEFQELMCTMIIETKEQDELIACSVKFTRAVATDVKMQLQYEV